MTDYTVFLAVGKPKIGIPPFSPFPPVKNPLASSAIRVGSAAFLAWKRGITWWRFRSGKRSLMSPGFFAGVYSFHEKHDHGGADGGDGHHVKDVEE